MKIVKELLPYVITIIVVVLIRTFIITPVRVDGSSMNPTLANDQILLLEKYDHNYKRFDIVVLYHNDERLVKRVIGLPGETVSYHDNKLYINGEYVEENFIDTTTHDFELSDIGETKIPDGKYFVVGDNRGASTDSRIIGLVNENVIQGKIVYSLFPFDRFGNIK
jgi:signal peptidase I